MKKFLCVSTLFFLLAVQTAWAEKPITIQGVAIDSKGLPLTGGNKSVTFNIYNSPTGGEALWSEQQMVPVEDGRFSATLGSANPLELSSDKTYWLGMRVGEGEELSPRIQLSKAGGNVNFGKSGDTSSEVQPNIFSNASGRVPGERIDQDNGVENLDAIAISDPSYANVSALLEATRAELDQTKAELNELKIRMEQLELMMQMPLAPTSSFGDASSSEYKNENFSDYQSFEIDQQVDENGRSKK